MLDEWLLVEIEEFNLYSQLWFVDMQNQFVQSIVGGVCGADIDTVTFVGAITGNGEAVGVISWWRIQWAFFYWNWSCFEVFDGVLV